MPTGDPRAAMAVLDRTRVDNRLLVRRSLQNRGPARRGTLRGSPMVAEALPSESNENDPYAGDPVFDLHVGGKIHVVSSVPLRDTDDLSIAVHTRAKIGRAHV